MSQQEIVPKVSVCVITYNQVGYIRQCLQSIVDQKTSFTFEVIVGDDCSLDGTRAVVQEFAERYPDVVRPIYHERNIGGGCNNYLAVHRAARGEYVAHLDGDDAMLPDKLQCQADILDEKTNCSASFHLMEVMNEESIRGNKLWLAERYGSEFFVEDLLMGHPNVGHSSIMYRKSLLKDFFENLSSDFIDLHIYLALARVGPLASINRVLGLYRVGVGASANEKVLDLVFDAVESVDDSMVNSTVTSAAAVRFSRNFAASMLLINNRRLFLKYFKLKIRYLRHAGFLDLFILNSARHELSFFIISLLYKFLVRVRR